MERKYSVLLTKIYTKVGKRLGLSRKTVRVVYGAYWCWLQKMMEMYEYDLDIPGKSWPELLSEAQFGHHLPELGYIFVSFNKYFRYHRKYAVEQDTLLGEVSDLLLKEDIKDEVKED